MIAVTSARPRTPEAAPPQASATAKGHYRPDIEGLRALAVALVVMYHVGLPGVDGGFVGVDVFFVISGFLITGLLVRELSSTGRIDLPRFYARRIRRLLPASMVVAVATIALAKLVVSPLALLDLRQDAVATFAYVANYWLALRNTNYLQAGIESSPFQHYWSLAVEEQFYLLWPALLIVAVVVLRRYGPRRASLAAILAALTVSFVACVVLTAYLQPWAFFGLPTRAWELAAGGVIALTAGRLRTLSRATGQLLGWIGLTLTAIAAVALPGRAQFPGWVVVIPVTAAALLIISGTVGGGPVQAALGCRPLTFVGRLSYSIYLWHWPLLVLADGVRGGSLSWPGRVAMVGATVAAAGLTYRFVENPLRHQRWLSARPRRSVVFAAGATALAALAALVIAIPPTLHDGRPAEPLAGHVPSRDRWTTFVPSNLRPSLRAAANHFPVVFSDGCHRGFTQVTVDGCVYGEAHSKTAIVLYGDSHAAQWFPPLRDIADRHHLRMVSLTKSGCPSATVTKASAYLGREYRECYEWRRNALSRIDAERPALVILANGTNATHDPTRVPDADWLLGMTKTIDRLAEVPNVTVLADSPYAESDVPSCLSGALTTALSCALVRSVGVSAELSRAEAGLVRDKGREVVDLTGYLCSDNTCPAIIGDTLVYLDRHHLSPEITTALSSVLEEHVLANISAPPGADR